MTTPKPNKSPALAHLEQLIQESQLRNEFLLQGIESLSQSISQLQAEIQETKQEYGLEASTKSYCEGSGADLLPKTE